MTVNRSTGKNKISHLFSFFFSLFSFMNLAPHTACAGQILFLWDCIKLFYSAIARRSAAMIRPSKTRRLGSLFSCTWGSSR